MRYLLLLTIVSVTGCATSSQMTDCINYEVFGPYDHSCPQDKHGPCPFCTHEQQHHIKLAEL